MVLLLLSRPFGWKKFGTVFEMHRIIMIPIAAPYEAVPFEDTDNLKRNLIVPFGFGFAA